MLKAYAKECFQFSDDFLRLILPASEQLTPQDTPQVEELLKIMVGQHSRQELQELLALTDRENFRLNYLQPAINNGYVVLTIPDKPTSKNQKYYLTEKGKQYLNSL
ncbi:Fic family protein [Pseudopedobacter beijingensis]|uniref:Fic family protein n=1 Tax=Pseudopedobacter beijingensis TaxID=1207056 RepID=A0ABW4IEW4_9SPHI